MLSPFVQKEANRYFWLSKGRLIPKHEPDHKVEEYYHEYIKRIWNNESGATDIYELGFEQAYKEREAEIANEFGMIQKGTCFK